MNLVLLVISIFSQGQVQPAIPQPIQEIIEEIKSEPVRNPPAIVIEYLYEKDTVFYVPGFCCDQQSLLYDMDGQVICNPDGGFSGIGDDRCSDFFDTRENEKVVWRDPR